MAVGVNFVCEDVFVLEVWELLFDVWEDDVLHHSSHFAGYAGHDVDLRIV